MGSGGSSERVRPVGLSWQGKKDSLFVEVLEAVMTLAQEWNDTEELRAMDEAVRKLRLRRWRWLTSL